MYKITKLDDSHNLQQINEVTTKSPWLYDAHDQE